MSKKILFTASTQSHIENFHRPYLQAFEDLGWEVITVALPVSKCFLSLQNLRAILSTRKLLQREQVDLVSSHATLAGAVTRLAVMLLSKPQRPKVFHTAHGYLFHDQGLKKWAYLLPELFCGKVTDVLMVMNQEDLQIAKKYKLCGKQNHIYYIDGMGVDFSKFKTVLTAEPQPQAFSLSGEDFIWVYAGEFSKRKNHALLLHAFAQSLVILKDRFQESRPPMVLALAGSGTLLETAKQLAQNLHIETHVQFLGYVKNMDALYPCCQAAVTTSKIEGLPFNVMEAMACGLPVVASKIKGHQELIDHSENGLLFDLADPNQLAQHLIEVYQNSTFRAQCRQASQKKLSQFSIETVLPQIMKIYQRHW